MLWDVGSFFRVQSVLFAWQRSALQFVSVMLACPGEGGFAATAAVAPRLITASAAMSTRMSCIRLIIACTVLTPHTYARLRCLRGQKIESVPSNRLIQHYEKRTSAHVTLSHPHSLSLTS